MTFWSHTPLFNDFIASNHLMQRTSSIIDIFYWLRSHFSINITQAKLKIEFTHEQKGGLHGQFILNVSRKKRKKKKSKPKKIHVNQKFSTFLISIIH